MFSCLFDKKYPPGSQRRTLTIYIIGYKIIKDCGRKAFACNDLDNIMMLSA